MRQKMESYQQLVHWAGARACPMTPSAPFTQHTAARPGSVLCQSHTGVQASQVPAPVCFLDTRLINQSINQVIHPFVYHDCFEYDLRPRVHVSAPGACGRLFIAFLGSMVLTRPAAWQVMLFTPLVSQPLQHVTASPWMHLSIQPVQWIILRCFAHITTGVCPASCSHALPVPSRAAVPLMRFLSLKPAC